MVTVWTIIAEPTISLYLSFELKVCYQLLELDTVDCPLYILKVSFCLFKLKVHQQDISSFKTPYCLTESPEVFLNIFTSG